MGEIQCPRCEKVYNPTYDGMRFRSGTFHDPGRGETYDQLCERCHREVVKER